MTESKRDIVFAPTLVDDPGKPGNRLVRFQRKCKNRKGKWTCKKTAKRGDFYLFWFGGTTRAVVGLGVVRGPAERENNSSWHNCEFKPLVWLASPISLADIHSDTILDKWWKTKPFPGWPKSLLADKKVARRLLGMIAKRNPKLQFLLGDEGIWLAGKEAHLPQEPGIAFRPGCRPKRESAKAQTKTEIKTILLRENKLQRALYEKLCGRYGKNSVGTEVPTGTGGRIDVVVLRRGKNTYYEIKSDSCIRTCLRDAIGQLVEYAYWTPGNVAEKLIVVSESPLTSEAGRTSPL